MALSTCSGVWSDAAALEVIDPIDDDMPPMREERPVSPLLLLLPRADIRSLA